jgi:hypothetical protein
MKNKYIIIIAAIIIMSGIASAGINEVIKENKTTSTKTYQSIKLKKDNGIKIENDLIEDTSSYYDGDLHQYLITTLAWTKDKLGLTIDVSGYRIYFYHQEFENGTDYIDFYDIQFADKVAKEEELEWYHIPGLDRLEIYVPKNFDLYNVTDEFNEFPHDSLESYFVYTTLIDVLAFDSHKNVFRKELFGTNKTSYNTLKMQSTMPDWLPIINDINALVAETYYTYIAGMNDENADQVFFYKNDDTLLNQTMHLDEFPFPMVVEGTTRFFGHITINSENTITRGTLTEYFLSKITLFKVIPIYSFIRREQIMEIIE